MPQNTSPLTQLRDASLLKTEGLINGQWVAGTSRFAVHDPATGAHLADVANLGPQDAKAAIAAANAAWPAWRSKTAKERSIILRKWYDLLMANQDDLARIMTAEQGKPFPEAKGEVAYGASFVEWFAEEAKRVNGETLPQFDNNRRLMVHQAAHWRVRGHYALELPAGHDHPQGGPGPGGGLHGGHQAGRAHPAHRPGRLPSWPSVRAFRPVCSTCSRADADNSIAIGKVLCESPIVRHISFTGSHRSGPHPDGAKRAHGEEDVAGTRWQCALHRL